MNFRKDGETIVVQCKSHNKPVGPATARELYGAMMDFGADRAILACTAGFTKGARDFVDGGKGKPKPIDLVGPDVSGGQLNLWDTGKNSFLPTTLEAFL